MDYDTIQSLFAKKKDCFIRIKTMTEKASIDETLESTDTYILLMDRRAAVFREIAVLDKVITETQIPSTETKLLNNIKTIQKEIKVIVEQIIQFDKTNQKLAAGIKEALKKGLQEVHNGKASARMYNHDILYSEISRFDSKS